MRKLHLDDLKSGQPGLSPKAAAFMVEAAVVCLELNGHQSGVLLEVEGSYLETFQLYWTDKIDLRIINSWKDRKEAAEYASTAIALLLMIALENLVSKVRLEQSDEADYALQKKQVHKVVALLEVSGLFIETPSNTISARVNSKQVKLNKSRQKKQFETVFIVVTEFGQPATKIEKNE